MLVPSLSAPLQQWHAQQQKQQQKWYAQQQQGQQQQWEQQQQQEEEEEAVAVAAALTTCSTSATTDSEQLLQPCSNTPTDVDGITGPISDAGDASTTWRVATGVKVAQKVHP